MLKCPKCHIPLCSLEYEGATVQVCPDCRGSLVDVQRFRMIAQRHDRSRPHTPVAPAEATGGHQSQGPLASEPVPPAQPQGGAAQASPPQSTAPEPMRCPKCLQKMKEAAVPMGGELIRFDLCGPCNVLWFGQGELQRGQALYDREQAGLTPDERDRISGAARRRLPEPQEAPGLLADVTSYTTPPFGNQFDVNLDQYGFFGRILNLLIAAGRHEGQTGWPLL